MGDERRRVRKTLNYFVDVFDFATNKKVGLMVDLSDDGMMLASQEPIQVDREFTFNIVDNRAPDADAEKQPFTAKSIWCRQAGDDGYDVGFELVEVSSAAKSQFDAFRKNQHYS